MELGLVEWLRERLPQSPGVPVGVGDDAAVVALRGTALVATSDLLIDGVHFLTAEHAPQRIGRKALAVNLSDLAAMAARPRGALVSLALPRGGAGGLAPRELAQRLIDGMAPLAEEFGCPIVGGDTNVGPGPLVVSVTTFGEPTERGVVRRSGARPGDWLLVTGDGLGGSLAGKHLDFTPRVREALDLAGAADLHAMMDLSDGLSLDLHRLCRASGVGAVIQDALLPVAAAAYDRSLATGRTPIDHALSDGEDFELLLAVSPAEGADLLARGVVPGGLTRIGEVCAGERLERRAADGSLRPLDPLGYEHR